MPYYIDKETGKQVEGWSWHTGQKHLPSWVRELIDGGTIERRGRALEYEGEKYYSGCFLIRNPLGICNLQSFKRHYISTLKCTVKKKRAANKKGYFERQYDYT